MENTFTKEEILKTIRVMVGDIQPVGETNTDNRNFENLKILCEVVDDLVYDIDSVHSRNEISKEFSVKRAADYAIDFIRDTLGIE